MKRDPASPFSVERNVLLVRLYMTAMFFAPFMSIWVIYLTDFRDISLTQVAIMEGFFWAVSTVAEIPSGAFADRFGRRKTFLVGCSIEACGLLAFGLAGTFEILTLSYILWATGIAFGSGNAQAFLYDTLAAGKRTGEYARESGRLHAIQTGTGLVGGGLGAGLAAILTLQAPILAAVAIYGIGLVVAFAMDEPPGTRPDDGATSYTRTLLGAVSLMREQPAVRYIIVFMILISLATTTEWILLQPFLDSHGVPIAIFGLMAIPIRLSSMGASLGAHRFLAVVGIRRSVGGSFVTMIAGLALLAAVDHVAAFVGIVLVQGAIALSRPGVDAYINDRTSSSVRATVLSFAPFGMSLALACTIPFVGVAADEDLRLAFGAMALVLGTAAGAVYLLWLKADRGPIAPSPIEPPEPLVAPGG